jgi:hypothetical protein
MVLLCLFCSSCFFHPREVKRLPDTPVMIGEIKGNYVEVFSYSKEIGAMVRIGFVDLREYKGWTISKFDWSTLTATRGN